MLKVGDIHSITVQSHDTSSRLDTFLTQQFPDYSRTIFQDLIERGYVTVNKKVPRKSGIALKEGDVIEISIPRPPEKEIITATRAAEMKIKILYKESDFAIVEKPAGIVVHAPHEKSTEITLANWIVFTFKEIGNGFDVNFADRPGIVHRLDKDTSGIMIIPLNNQAHLTFANMFKNRSINKTYYALVEGHPDKEGRINIPIGRDTTSRIKMAHRPEGRPSETKYKVVEYFQHMTLIKVEPLTGRTHQIRVHCASIGHPILGDMVYGKSSTLIKRQALHASLLQFSYKSKDYLFESPLPKDMIEVIETLKNTDKK